MKVECACPYCGNFHLHDCTDKGFSFNEFCPTCGKLHHAYESEYTKPSLDRIC